MGIKVTVQSPDTAEYPCLGKYPNGMVVLFTSCNTGTVLVKSTNGTNDIGYWCDNFTRGWQVFDGTLELKNEQR